MFLLDPRRQMIAKLIKILALTFEIILPAFPVERLIDQRHELLAPSAEKDRADRNAFRFFPPGRVGWTLLDRDCKPGIGVCCGMTALRIPWFAPPVLSVSRHRIIMTFPPDGAVRSKRDVGEDCVILDHLHGVLIGLGTGARRNSKESCFR